MDAYGGFWGICIAFQGDDREGHSEVRESRRIRSNLKSRNSFPRGYGSEFL